MQKKKISPSNTAVFSGKGVSIETVLKFCLQFTLLNIVDKIATTNSQIDNTNAL